MIPKDTNNPYVLNITAKLQPSKENMYYNLRLYFYSLFKKKLFFPSNKIKITLRFKIIQHISHLEFMHKHKQAKYIWSMKI